jgi:hypothetical protein
LSSASQTFRFSLTISNREIVMLKHLLILFSAIAASGCASMLGDPASEPKEGARARLRTIYGTSWVDQNVCGDRPDLSEGVFVYLGTPYEKRSLGMPRGTLANMPARAWGEMHVRADRQIKVRANFATGGANCGGAVYFKPEKDRDYEIVLSGCILSAYDITGGNVKPLPISEQKLPCN